MIYLPKHCLITLQLFVQGIFLYFMDNVTEYPAEDGVKQDSIPVITES